ncbi:hypothetical protein Tco_0648777 [Tanacetum coccineum]
MYAMTCIRPDVSFAVSMVSRHQQNPSEGHWTTVKNILKYLRNTKDRFLVYGREKELRVTGYCDTSWQTDKDDSHLQFGWVFLLNRGAVTWKSSKQDTVVDSTCESEYIAAFVKTTRAIGTMKVNVVQKEKMGHGWYWWYCCWWWDHGWILEMHFYEIRKIMEEMHILVGSFGGDGAFGLGMGVGVSTSSSCCEGQMFKDFLHIGLTKILGFLDNLEEGF